MKALKQALFAFGLTISAFCGAARAETTYFQDDFTTWNPGKWSVYDGTNFLQRTQFGNVPQIISEGGTTFARLNLDTYNPDPAYTGRYLRGTEILAKSVVPVGNGVEFEARLRGKNLPPGIVFAFFTYNARGVWPSTYLKDEIDFEFLTTFNKNEMWLNIWDDWNPERFGPNESSRTAATGLDWSTWNTYKIRWMDSVVEWYVNDVLVRRSTQIVPKDPMQLRLDIWAASDTWPLAYNANLQAATSASANQSYAMDVDWVKVHSLPEGVTGTGTGLLGTYYDNKDFTGTTLIRIDPTVDFLWRYDAPAPSIGAETFSTRWEGQVQAQYSENYTFTTNSDDGIRLWVNGQKLVDSWINQSPTEYSGTIALLAGQKYDIKIEYYENTDGAVAQLFWSSLRTPKQIVPRSQLYPKAAPDTTPPTATILSPTKNGIYKSQPSFNGTAADSDSGVRIVYARLRRLSDSKYWNGSAWVAGATLVRVTGTTNWAWTPPTLADGYYTLQMRTEDVVRNVFYTTALKFLIDKTLPSATITAPVQNQTYASLTTIKGTARDSGSGVRVVYARLRRLADNKYWNGSAWVIGASLVRVTGTTTWTWAPPALVNGAYTVQMRAEDKAFNVFYTPARRFSISSAASLARTLSQRVTLSDAQARGDEISLFFTGTVGESALNASTWLVTVDGESVAVKSVAVVEGTVVVQLETNLKVGSEVVVAWPQLRDGQGNAIVGSWQGATQ